MNSNTSMESVCSLPAQIYIESSLAATADLTIM